MWELVTLPDGSTVYVDSATGQPVSSALPALAEPSANVAPSVPRSAPPSPSTPAAPVSLPGVTSAPPAGALPPLPPGSVGLPADPLGDGPTVPGGADLPLAGAVAPASDWVDYGGYGGYGGYARGGYDGYGSGFDGGYAQDPRYANTAYHPYFGGPAPVPGGVFAAPGGDGYRPQVTASSGATAGPFEISAAPAPRGGSYGSGGGSSGGGGSIARDLYWRFAGKVKGKLTGEAEGDAGYQPYRDPRPYLGPDDPRTQRRIGRLDPRMRGPYARGWDADAARGFMSHPEYMLGSRKVLPDLNRDSLLYDRLESLPMAQLTLLAGAGKKNWQGGLNPMEDVYGDYYDKLNRRLSHGRAGIDFEPFYRKHLRRDRSLSDFTNSLGRLYNQIGSGQVFDTEALLGNLAAPRKGTYFREAFKPGRSGNTVAGMGDTYLSAYNAILQAGPYGDIQRQVLSDRASDAVADWYARFGGKKNARHAPRLNRWVTQRL